MKIEERTIKFKHLSFPVQVGIVGGFSFAIYFVVMFLWGFLLGMLGFV